MYCVFVCSFYPFSVFFYTFIVHKSHDNCHNKGKISNIGINFWENGIDDYWKLL